MSKIDFSRIGDMLNSSTNFSLTEKQYKKLTGRDMPKGTSYLIHKSALSKYVSERGLKIKVNEKTITFEKV